MKRFLTITLILFLCGLSQSALAQHEKTSLLIDANLSLPFGDYGETIGEKPQITRRFGFDYGEQVGLASMGYGLGIELHTPAFIDHLSWILSLQMILNPTDDDNVNRFFSGVVDDTTNLSIENGTWFHVPLMTGFSYGIGIVDGFNLYVSVQGGINVTKQASREAYVNGEQVEQTTFDTEIDFGFGSGITLEFMDKYNLSIKYLNLSQPRYEGTRKLDIVYFDNAYLNKNPIFGDERTIQMFLISLGYRL